MLRRIVTGLLLALVTSIFNVLDLQFLSNTWKELFSQMLLGISYVFINPVSLEFTVAQSPVQYRGVMVSMWYAAWQIGFVIKICLGFIFNSLKFYYHLARIILLLIILIVFVVLAKQYKYCVRENDVNIYQIVDNAYHNYIEQEAEYDNQENSINTK